MKKFRSTPRPRKNTLVVGRTAVLEALQKGRQLDKIYLDTKAGGEVVAKIKQLASTKHIPVSYVPVAKLNSFNIEEHEGCVAQLSKINYVALEEQLSFLMDTGEAPLLLILDGITDIRNIGGIARTAYCCGVHALVIPDKGVGALNEDAILTSAGALEKLTVCRVGSLMKAVDEMHLHGIKVYASDMEAAQSIATTDFKEPCAIIMGSEEKGVYPALMKICDGVIKIPMRGGFESLNVSVATGMILYEAMKQRLDE